jgi:hypothetical protein
MTIQEQGAGVLQAARRVGQARGEVVEAHNRPAGVCPCVAITHHPEEDSDIDMRVIVSVELDQRHGGFE